VPIVGSAAVAAALAPQLFPLLQLAGCEEAAAATLAAGCVAALTRLLPNDVGGIFLSSHQLRTPCTAGLRSVQALASRILPCTSQLLHGFAVHASNSRQHTKSERPIRV
jgi:hypothetical protein